VAILDRSGNIVADLNATGQFYPNGDPVGICVLSLSPGAYELRYSIGGGAHVAQSLVLPPGGWRLEAYLLRYGDSASARPAITVLMRRIGGPWGTPEDVQMQKALVALADERPIAEGELMELLLEKFDNPVAAIVGAHLLLISAERAGAKPPERLNQVVTRLRALVGNEHPDVEALSLVCPNANLRAAHPVLVPPVFERSWRLLVGESYDRSDLIPLPLWQRVNASLLAPPYFCWSPDEEVRQDFLAAQAESAFGRVSATQPPSPTSPRPPARPRAAPWSWSGMLELLRSRVGRQVVRGDLVGNITEAALESRELRSRLVARAKTLGLPSVALNALQELRAERGRNSHGRTGVDE
jgi:hypothetical protein